MNEYIESQARAGIPVFLDGMVCKDCKYRDERRSAVCKVYRLGEAWKPDRVLKGGYCLDYVRGD